MNLPFLKKYQPKKYNEFVIDEAYIQLLKTLMHTAQYITQFLSEIIFSFKLCCLIYCENEIKLCLK